MDHDAMNGDVIELRPEDYTVEELRAALESEEPTLPKVFALELLRRKNPPGAVDDLQRVLINEAETPDVRRNAAVELERLASPEAASALRQAAGVAQPFVREGVVAAVRRLDRAAEGHADPSPQRPAVESRSETLARFFAGAPEARVDLPAHTRLLELERARLAQIHAQPLDSEEVARAVSQVAPLLPHDVVADGALAFECQGTGILYVPTAEQTYADPRRLLEGPAVVGHVALHLTAEVDHWELTYHVLTQPGPVPETIDVYLVDREGEPIFSGKATVAGITGRFSLVSIDRPGAVAARVTGTFDAKGVHVDKARSSTVARTLAVPARRPYPDR